MGNKFYASLVGSDSSERGEKIRKFVKRNLRRNRDFYEDPSLVEGIDYITCPLLGVRLSMIKRTYIENILGWTKEEYEKRFPNTKYICNKRIVNIKKGLKSIDEKTGLTKHELSRINSGKMLHSDVSIPFRRRKCSFDTYASQISWVEPVRRSPQDKNILEVKCAYCGKWFSPLQLYVDNRIAFLKGRVGSERRLYCSENCKILCPVYNQEKYYKFQEGQGSREVQPELRQLVFRRDDYTCKKCGSGGGRIQCHHILPVALDPLESADIDNCVTLCVDCHKEVHLTPGCGYGELRKCL